jgi:hypothetical protein
MLDELHMAIAAVADPPARPRLAAAVPRLVEAVDRWCGPLPGDQLVIAAATPRSCVVFATTGWPPCDQDAAAEVDRGKAAMAIVAAIESAPTVETTNRILDGLTVLLGHAGIAAQCADARVIVERGGSPLVVALFEWQPESVTVLCTTVSFALGARTLH